MDGGLLCNLSDEILLANQDPVNSICVVVKMWALLHGLVTLIHVNTVADCLFSLSI